VVILHRQQIGLPGFEPALGRTALALRAVPVPAGSGELSRMQRVFWLPGAAS
jgi:hypothetical protein